MGDQTLKDSFPPDLPRILLVDPQPDCLGVLTTQCGQFDGEQLDVVRDPVEALRCASRRQYDWVILDVADLADAADALVRILRELDPGIRVVALNDKALHTQWACPGVVVADKIDVAPICSRLKRRRQHLRHRSGSRID